MDYFPGSLRLTEEEMVLLMKEDVDKIYLKFDYNIISNKKHVINNYETEFSAAWLKSRYVILNFVGYNKKTGDFTLSVNTQEQQYVKLPE
ncbi:hypothetical protein [Ekhidna sp.]